jgi:hypothetical protein
MAQTLTPDVVRSRLVVPRPKVVAGGVTLTPEAAPVRPGAPRRDGGN